MYIRRSQLLRAPAVDPSCQGQTRQLARGPSIQRPQMVDVSLPHVAVPCEAPLRPPGANISSGVKGEKARCSERSVGTLHPPARDLCLTPLYGLLCPRISKAFGISLVFDES